MEVWAGLAKPLNDMMSVGCECECGRLLWCRIGWVDKEGLYAANWSTL